MQQRVVIAMALAKDPELLILDEPTTGLDATVEAEVLDLVAQLQSELDTAVLFISHNLGVISKMCDRVGVLYAGRLVEEGPVETVLQDPRHPYTVGLLRCIPRGGVRKDHGRLDTIPGFLPTLGAEIPGCVFADRCALADERCHDGGAAARSRCVPDTRAAAGTTSAPRCFLARSCADIELPAVDRARAAARRARRARRRCSSNAATTFTRSQRRQRRDLAGRDARARRRVGEREDDARPDAARASSPPTTRHGELDGHAASARATRSGRRIELRALQIVFQNPDSALNRRHSVRRILLRSLRKLARCQRRCGRAADAGSRLARAPDGADVDAEAAQLSGGLKQRVAIARAFAGDPRLVVCDEPTSALDVSVQAAILNLLVELQAEKQVAYLFISHDLGVVRYISDRIAVLYLGRVQELGPADVVFNGPHHPYTEALLSAVPTVDGGGRDRIKLEGDIPSAAAPPSGCVFHTRCPRFLGQICIEQEPPLVEAEEGHLMRCHIPIEELRRLQAKDAAAV